MAILIDVPTPAISTTPSLLATLQSISRFYNTRAELANEFDSAFSSYITDTPVPLSGPDGDILASSSAAGRTNDSSSSDPNSSDEGRTCANESARGIESVRPPNQEELEEIMKVYFRGEMELRESISEALEQLRGYGRVDLVGVVLEVERVEDLRLKETISRDSLRRLGTLEPEENFTDAIAASNKKFAFSLVFVDCQLMGTRADGLG